jgi:hypothetical protein
MASVQILPKVGEADRREWKIVGAVTDTDVGKPVKLSAGDGQVTLCSDGDAIYGFIDSVERGTDGGLIVVTLVETGTVRVTASGTVALGAIVEAGANTAAGTLPVSWGIVSTQADIAADLATDASGTEISVAVNAILAAMLLDNKKWVALTAAGDGEDFVIKAA